MNTVWLLLSFVMISMKGVTALRDVRVVVPKSVRAGDGVTLYCNYLLEGEALYTVNWYKGNDEFFRFTPREKPPVKIFEAIGIPANAIDLSKSNSTQLTLKETTINMTGLYSCEVSADSPSFHTAYSSGDMVVVEPPMGRLEMSVLHLKLNVGQMNYANCSTAASIPPANITWSINSFPVNSDSYSFVHQKYERGLTRTLSLLRIDPFAYRLRKGGRLRVRCTASIHNIYWETNDKIIEYVSDNRVDSRRPEKIPGSRGKYNPNRKLPLGTEEYTTDYSDPVSDWPDITTPGNPSCGSVVTRSYLSFLFFTTIAITAQIPVSC